MNRGDWRDRATRECNWKIDNDDDFTEEVAGFQRTVLDRLSERCPEAFVPDDETVFVYPDKTHGDFRRKIDATVDARVLAFGALPGPVFPATDGTWDGLFHIEVKDPAGMWHRRRCLEFFQDLMGGYYVTIDRDWGDLADRAMEFRLHQPYFVLRDDVMGVTDGKVWDSTRQRLENFPEGFARYADDQDFQGTTKGRPLYIYRSKREKMPDPNRAPRLAPTEGLNPQPWVGPEPTGSFTYVYTRVWGRKDRELVAPGGTRDPQFESSPSPASTSITVPTSGVTAVVVTVPNIDYMRGFGTPATLSEQHSGWRTRIYRKRATVTGGIGDITREVGVGIYYLLDEIDGSSTTYIDDGTKLPDYHRRLPESHGYYLWRAAPHQDATYQIDLRVLRKPLPLYNDSDAPDTHPSANEMLIEGLKAKLFHKKGDHDNGYRSAARFETMMSEFRASQQPARIVPGQMWGPQQPRAGNDFYTRYGRFS